MGVTGVRGVRGAKPQPRPLRDAAALVGNGRDVMFGAAGSSRLQPQLAWPAGPQPVWLHLKLDFDEGEALDMGGINSGRRATTPDTDDCLRLSLTDLRRAGAINRHCMSRRHLTWTTSHGWSRTVTGEVTVGVDIECLHTDMTLTIMGHAMGQPIKQVIALVAQPQPLGGERFYALCPIGGHRCTGLILPPGETVFASVRGWGVPYASTREDKVSRAIRTMGKVEARRRTMSKYTRKPTREQLAERWMRAADTYFDWEERVAAYM